jgi:hypothetical protein
MRTTSDSWAFGVRTLRQNQEPSEVIQFSKQKIRQVISEEGKAMIR